ncbi:hypothetical protein M3Y97_00455700 [Aphelenchoides bicaudatus]|nr:hypothetical protein M3Y97_00455700 [Aphelenchoides bicaudatus]
MFWRCLLILCCVVIACSACKINLKIRSGTKRPFQVEVAIPSVGKQTEILEVHRIGVVKRTTVEGKNCNSKPWIIRTYGKKHSDDFEKAHEHKARFDGDGEVTIIILDDLVPRVTSRDGVACSETLICG